MLRLSLDVLLAFAALIVAVVGVFYSRQSTAKRELLVLSQAPTPLLHKMGDLARIAVWYDGQPVLTPYVTVLQLWSTGRNAVTTAHFDQNRPLLVDIGVPIVDVLQVNSTRGGFAMGTSETNVAFGPDLLAKRDEVEVHLLTSGEPVLSGKASLVTHHLIDTRVEFVEPGSAPMKKRRLNVGISTAFAVCVVAFVIAAVFVRVNSGNPTLRLSPVTVRSGGMIDVGLSQFEGSQTTLLFMGTKRSVRLANGSATLVLRVPRGTAQGRYFVVLLTTVGGYPGDIEKPFFVQ